MSRARCIHPRKCSIWARYGNESGWQNDPIDRGTGSFGNAFTKRILREWPDVTLRIFSRDELKQLEMYERYPGSTQLRFFIGDVRDRSRLDRAMAGVDIVIMRGR